MENFLDVKPLDCFVDVDSQEKLDDFFKLTHNLHDGLIKEMHIINEAYVDSDLSMSADFQYNLRILIQKQWKNPSAIEILLGNVSKLDLVESNYLSNAFGEYKENKMNGKKTIKLDFDCNRITCSRMLYRDASNWMGRESRFGEEIVLSSLMPVEDLGEGWYMCTNCTHTWKPNNRLIKRCPNCGGKNSGYGWISSPS
ncbi:hypothetical protein [Mechercharimyces sp. CAU 1602]|uniref:hypothetical protein n=1 Tax=Mechercharimyces sp. CAU 1602 TaxID=2973933 RepID=UPI0021611723|nr:hypothetical protein [Mechercharimyces sp. CAU 1602]MCS1350867.1 hypothetical protein [Mechercharimyces sp. CAU 1602]